MYLYTALGAGLSGLAMLFAPAWILALLAVPSQDDALLGAVGSVYVAFGGLALLGLRWPLRMLPVLLLQMSYKVLWLVAVFLPLALAAESPAHAWLMAVVFASYVLGDYIAIPFRRIFSETGTD